MMLLAFVVPCGAAFAFGQLNVRELNLTVNRMNSTIDANSRSVLKGEEEDYQKTIEYGLENAESALDWSVVGTHLFRAREFEYAFHAYYLAYLLSGGKMIPLRDWSHESLYEITPQKPENIT
jgi:hypothetical protein